MPFVFIASLEPPLEPDVVQNDSGVNAAIYPLGPVVILPANIPLAVNPASITLVNPSTPLSPAAPLI